MVLEGEQLFIRAKVHALTGYSEHADQKGLVEWVGGMSEVGRIKLVHGGRKARETLKGIFYPFQPKAVLGNHDIINRES